MSTDFGREIAADLTACNAYISWTWNRSQANSLQWVQILAQKSKPSWQLAMSTDFGPEIGAELTACNEHRFWPKSRSRADSLQWVQILAQKSQPSLQWVYFTERNASREYRFGSCAAHVAQNIDSDHVPLMSLRFLGLALTLTLYLTLTLTLITLILILTLNLNLTLLRTPSKNPKKPERHERHMTRL